MDFRNLDCCKRRLLSTRLLLSTAPERRSQSALLIKMLLPSVITRHWNLFQASVDHIVHLACLPHYIPGQTYYYPAFNAGRTENAVKFAHEFGAVMATPIILGAVTRVRTSRGEIFLYHSLTIWIVGLRTVSFHGNFFVRSTDLLAMPAVPRDLLHWCSSGGREARHQPLG